MRRTFAIISCFLLTGVGKSQTPDWVNFSGWSTYSVSDAGNSLWVSGFGLCKFDKATGTQQVFNFANSPLNYSSRQSVLAADGSIWLVNKQGSELMQFDGTSVWTPYGSADFGVPVGPSDIDHLTAAPNGNIAFAGYTLFGLCIWNGTSWNHYDSSNSPLSSGIDGIGYDTQNRLWVLTGQDLLRYDGSVWTTFNFPAPGYFPVSPAENLYVDRFDKVWISCSATSANNKCLVRFDGNNWTEFTMNQMANTNTPFSVSSLEIDINNNIWVINSGTRLLKYDGSIWTNLGSICDYTSTHYGDLTSDSNGVLWFSGRSIVAVSSSSFTSYPDLCSSLTNAAVRCMASAGHEYAFGYTDSTFSMEGVANRTLLGWSTNNTYQPFAGSPFPQWVPGNVSSLTIRGNGEMFAKSEHGVIKYSNGVWDTIGYPYANATQSVLRVNQNGDLYVCVNNEIAKYSGQIWTTYCKLP